MRRLAAILILVPEAALAHAAERMVILTLPTGWYMIGAALAVTLTAILGLSAERLPAFRSHPGFERPVLLPRPVASWIAAGVFWALIALGVFGPRDPFGNLLTLTVWVVIWVGLTLACALFGNLWRDVEPWTGPVRFLRNRFGLGGGIGLARLGYWPATLGYMGFAWFEIVSLSPADPLVLARVAAGYYLVILVLAVLEGEEWIGQGEFLTVYFGFVARIAPFWAATDGKRLAIRGGLPGAQVLAMPPLSSSAIAFVTLVLASVSFDGLAETFWWLAMIGLNPLEFPGRSAVLGVNSLALAGFWLLSAGLILVAIRLGLPDAAAFRKAAGPMMLAFLPIAAGYHIAHYLVSLLTQGQYVIAALSDPLDRDWNLLGLRDHFVSFGFLSTQKGVVAIWIAQFAVILAAHVLAVTLSLRLSHGVAGASGWRAHLPMTFLMVAYTVFGLWLLASPTAG